MPKRVTINDVTGEMKEYFHGDHVLLSVDEYNAIVWALTYIEPIMSELKPRQEFIDGFIKQNDKLDLVDR